MLKEMEYIYAALLLHKAGQQINEDNLKKVLSAAGLSPDDSRVKSVVAALSEINIDEAIKQAAATPAVAVAAAPAAPAAPEAPAKEEKKEEKKEEEEKEEALSGLSALFG